MLPPDLVKPLAAYFFLANLLTLTLFALRRAESGDGEWGANETRTLFFAILGGWPGAKLGQALFRQNAEPRCFRLVLNLSVLVLPVVIAVPMLIDEGPQWAALGMASFMPQRDKDAAQHESPTGAAYLAASDGVNGSQATAATTPGQNLPTRFGPGSGTEAKTSGPKMIKPPASTRN